MQAPVGNDAHVLAGAALGPAEARHRRLAASCEQILAPPRKALDNGKGSIGKLLNDDELYRKANNTIDQLNQIVSDINNGKGSAGKLLKDEQLYRNANETIAKASGFLAALKLQPQQEYFLPAPSVD